VITWADASAAQQAGERLGRILRAGDVVILTGPLGAGKTTLTQGIAAGLQVRGPITSPTFVIARRHPSQVGGPDLLHVDAYRVASAGQLWDLDLDTDDAVTVVEWGRDKAEGLQGEWLEIIVQRPVGSQPDVHGADDDGDEPRTVSWRSHGERWLHVDLGAALGGG